MLFPAKESFKNLGEIRLFKTKKKNRINHLQTCILRNVKRNSISRSKIPKRNLDLDNGMKKAGSGNRWVNLKRNFSSFLISLEDNLKFKAK